MLILQILKGCVLSAYGTKRLSNDAHMLSLDCWRTKIKYLQAAQKLHSFYQFQDYYLVY